MEVDILEILIENSIQRNKWKSKVIAEIDSFIDFKELEKQKQKLDTEWGTMIKIWHWRWLLFVESPHLEKWSPDNELYIRRSIILLKELKSFSFVICYLKKC